MSERFDALVRRESKVYVQAARRWPLALVRGDGSRVWDVDDREYIDLTAGWGVTCLGHGHPALVEAICDQARTLMQTTNIVYSEPQLELAERLDRITPDPIHRSFFVSSGAEANEGALKLAHGATGRPRFVATGGSFHGRTLGAMGALGQEKHRGRWEAIVHASTFVPYGDLDAARAALGPDVAGLIVEPVQGEGGVRVPAPDYLAGLRNACDEVGALLILDEIQTGIGRTGRWFALEHSGVVPDILTVGKGLGGGVPIAAFLGTEAVMATVERGDHGGTYAGNLLCCRAAATVLRVIEEEGLVERAEAEGTRIRARLRELAGRFGDRVEEVRGLGLLIGFVLRKPEEAGRVHTRLREKGVLANLTAERVIRIFPALNVPESDLEVGIDTLESVLAEGAAGRAD
jgi:predicted acetylornithine/succinylornithine family transaminase